MDHYGTRNRYDYMLDDGPPLDGGGEPRDPFSLGINWTDPDNIGGYTGQLQSEIGIAEPYTSQEDINSVSPSNFASSSSESVPTSTVSQYVHRNTNPFPVQPGSFFDNTAPIFLQGPVSQSMPQCGTNTLFPSQPPLNPESGFDFPLHPIQPSVPSYAGPAPVPIVSTSSSSPPHQDRQYRQCLWYIIQNHPDPVTLFRNGIENALTQQAAVQQQLHQNNQTNSNIPSDGPVQFPPELLSPFNEPQERYLNPNQNDLQDLFNLHILSNASTSGNAESPVTVTPPPADADNSSPSALGMSPKTKNRRSRINDRGNKTPQKPTSRRQIRARAISLNEVPVGLESFYKDATPGKHLTMQQAELMFDRITRQCRIPNCRYLWRNTRSGLNPEHVSKHLDHRPYHCSTCNGSYSRKENHPKHHPFTNSIIEESPHSD